jgi:type IV secretory pathway VirB6-like protein
MKSPYYCAIWPGVIYQNVTPDYFRTYGIKLITTYGILMTYGVISGGFRGPFSTGMISPALKIVDLLS